ncbi:MAG: metallophosphoesterase [Clostridia bacterium]|nr:metallophosphoesterase [Clostridia bacterium]MBQ9945203.1 metallophosphoesterase [Clostridia bacterium]
MQNKLSFYILTDTHYLSEAMWEEGESINNREKGDQIAIKCTPYVLRSFLNKIIQDKETPYVIITGDLINNGDRQSHEDFKKELKLLTDAGKTVFVTCATHDYAGLGDDENIFHPVYYKKDGCIPAERVYKTELPSLYYDFGHKYADSIDEESGSYSVSFPGGFRLIAIYDNGNGRSHCGLFDNGFAWLENELKKANENSETVFLAVHHPVIPPWQVYCDVAEFEMFGGYKRLREIMCEYGVRVIFTGHTHVHGIKEYKNGNGRSFYDITTSALPAAKGRMRKVVFDKTEGSCTVESISIDRIDGYDTGGLSAEEYIYRLNFGGLIENSLPLAKTDYEAFIENISHVFNPSVLKKHPFAAKRLISVFNRLRMSTVAAFAGKYADITKGDKLRLKNVYVKTVACCVLAHVFSGDAPYYPDTAEYKVISGAINKAVRLAKRFGYDIDALVPGSRTALETANDFLYNTRTGNDSYIKFFLED